MLHPFVDGIVVGPPVWAPIYSFMISSLPFAGQIGRRLTIDCNLFVFRCFKRWRRRRDRCAAQAEGTYCRAAVQSLCKNQRLHGEGTFFLHISSR